MPALAMAIARYPFQPLRDGIEAMMQNATYCTDEFLAVMREMAPDVFQDETTDRKRPIPGKAMLSMPERTDPSNPARSHGAP